MHPGCAWLAACALIAALPGATWAAECPGNPEGLGVSRILEVDTEGGPLLGTWQYPETLDLAPGEVVLTFDDGPHPRNTRRIIKALDRHCVKATFFAVGVWAEHVPKVVRELVARGHTLGAHTWSHPYRIDKLEFEVARRQIERGFEAVREAAGGTMAPFLRYPGLRDSDDMNAFAALRGYGVFSCDIATDDWSGIGARTIVSRTMARLKRRGSGIILLHDSKPATAKAVPMLLNSLKDQGYSVVHIVPKQPLTGPEMTVEAEGQAAGRTAVPPR